MTDLPDIAREAVDLAGRATPGPWVNASADMRCLSPQHKPGTHPGPPECAYEFVGWFTDPGYFGRFVSCETTREEIIGSGEDGPILSPADSRFIAHAGTHYATIARAFLAERERAERVGLSLTRNEAELDIQPFIDRIEQEIRAAARAAAERMRERCAAICDRWEDPKYSELDEVAYAIQQAIRALPLEDE